MNGSLPFWPREHGATVQVILAVGAALALGPVGRSSIGQASLTLLLFLASVPAGQHLPRRTPNSGALRRLGILAIMALALAVFSWWQVPLTRLVHLLVPLPSAVLLGMLLAKGREHSPTGELLASLSFALTAHPIALLGGQSSWRAAGLAGMLAAAFLLSAVSVRMLQRLPVPGLGRPWTLLPPLIGLAVMAGLEDLYQSGIARPRLTFALLPAVLATLTFVFRKPTKLKHVGWILTAGTLGATIWSVVQLR